MLVCLQVGVMPLGRRFVFASGQNRLFAMTGEHHNAMGPQPFSGLARLQELQIPCGVGTRR